MTVAAQSWNYRYLWFYSSVRNDSHVKYYQKRYKMHLLILERTVKEISILSYICTNISINSNRYTQGRKSNTN